MVTFTGFSFWADGEMGYMTMYQFVKVGIHRHSWETLFWFVTMIFWLLYTNEAIICFMEKATISYIIMCDTKTSVLYITLFLEYIYFVLCILKPINHAYKQKPDTHESLCIVSFT